MLAELDLLTGAIPHAFLMPRDYYNWISSFKSLTSSPGLKAGSPMYGQPSHLKASPKAPIRSQFYFTSLKAVLTIAAAPHFALYCEIDFGQIVGLELEYTKCLVGIGSFSFVLSLEFLC
jgi:hypothetical protein